jgi:CP family cyanate transporter-like MFS transporter
MTAAYTTLLTIGGATTAAVTLPVERGLGGDWRTGIGMWAATAVIALIPWLLLIRGTTRGPARAAGTRLPLSALARTRVAWVFSVLIGIGTGAFPLALTLIALRARTSLATTSLSAFNHAPAT